MRRHGRHGRRRRAVGCLRWRHDRCGLCAGRGARAGGGHRGRPSVGPRSGGGPADGRAPPAPALGDLLQRVFSATDEGLVVVDRGGAAVLANARACELGRRRRRQARRPGGRGLRRGAGARHGGRRRPVAARPARPPTRRRARAWCARSATATRWSRPPTRPTPCGWRPPAATSWPTSSHELKTPVGAVGLLAEAVLDAADDPAEVRRFGTKIVSEAHRLGQPRHRADRAVPAHRRRRAAGAVARRHRRGGGRGAGAAPGSRRRPRGSRSSSTSRSGWRSTATRRC